MERGNNSKKLEYILKSACSSCKINTRLAIMTTITARDMWNDPVEVAELLQLWDDVLGEAGGGLGSGLL